MSSCGGIPTSQQGTSNYEETSQDGNASYITETQALMSMPSNSQETSDAHLKRKTSLLDQNHYLRVMARELADIKAEQGDWRRLLFSNQSLGGIEENNGESRHPAFQKHVSLPLKMKADFKHFEEEE
ncbi:hypothetical protein OUZ56_024112 [Daphnia magna]|uniref:Uncharacterized protein n=1 Tax=Daphnia magna TaxID=35525 RepID=A0ABR0B064_9CRUS|nr:hypothetical protein OUZ56_024112 [Daphnia magna]